MVKSTVAWALYSCFVAFFVYLELDHVELSCQMCLQRLSFTISEVVSLVSFPVPYCEKY